MVHRERGGKGRAPVVAPVCCLLTLTCALVILLTMSTMTLAEAKAHLSEVVSRVSSQHERVTVTVHGRASAVLLAPEDLDRLEETIAVLADNELVQQLAQADSDVASGRVETADDLAEAMRRRTTTA